MRTRVVVVPVITEADNRVLLCRMAENLGVFPGQWAFAGGGVEEGERLEEALRREVREELGIELQSFSAVLFKDDVLEKTFEDGSTELLHMIFLVYRCTPASLDIQLNAELCEYRWASREDLLGLELNSVTRETLQSVGLLDLVTP